VKPSDNESPNDKLISNVVGRSNLEFNFAEWKLDHADAVREFQEQYRDQKGASRLDTPTGRMPHHRRN